MLKSQFESAQGNPNTSHDISTLEPLPHGVDNEETVTRLGRYASSIDPFEMMLTQFDTVLDYRHYRFGDTTASPTETTSGTSLESQLK